MIAHDGGAAGTDLLVAEANPLEARALPHRQLALLYRLERVQVAHLVLEVLLRVHDRALAADDEEPVAAGGERDDVLAVAKVFDAPLEAAPGEEAEVAPVGRDDDRARARDADLLRVGRLGEAADRERGRVLARAERVLPLGGLRP